MRAEELGFAGLWVLDSVPGSATSRVPLLGGLHVLTTAAATTSAIGLGIGVIVLAAHNATTETVSPRPGRFLRSRRDRFLGGVCGGLGD